ncbi:MAG: hypothetical protein MJ112_03265 [Lachnospiraceae bacterium]|nr:hypothetical protein [Lachnospiraceae bacterium]
MSLNYDDFLNKLQELKDGAYLQGGMVTSEQIDEMFSDLSEEQKKFIVEYLEKNHIGIDEAIDPKSYMSESEINLLDMYTESLEAIDYVSDSVKRVLMMDAIAGKKEAKEQLMQQYLQSVIDTARLYSGQGVDFMDLIGEGNVALAVAMEQLDCVEGPDDVEPLIMQMIMNAMEELCKEEGSSDDTMKKVLELVEKVQTKAKDMTEELLRKVTIDELSEDSGISRKKIKEALSVSETLYDYIEKDEEQ